MNRKFQWQQKLRKIATQFMLISLSLVPIALASKPALGAERIRFNFLSLNFSLSVDSLELYAKEGIIDKELQFYAGFLDDKALEQLRVVLSKRVEVEPLIVYRLSRSAMITDLLKGLGEVISTHLGYNGFYPIRGALVGAALDQEGEGLTLINVIRKFPTEDLWIDTDRIFQLRDELTTVMAYRDAAVEAIAQAAAIESSAGVKVNSTELDLQQSGNFEVDRQTIALPGRRRTSPLGLGKAGNFEVTLYIPKGLSEPAPIMILSHGFASNPRSLSYLGEHLASHGILVAAPEHIGSNADYELEILQGERTNPLKTVEFIERPLDVKYVLDELEKLAQDDPQWQGKLDLEAIGVIGHSFGGYTALTLAGASLNQAKLRRVCTQTTITLNMSLILQCRAKNLPPFAYGLQDPRVKGVIAINPVTSTVLGQTGLIKIQVPVMIIGGSDDVVAPVVPEQIHPFIWLTSPAKYLALMVPGNHFSNTDGSNEASSEPTVLENITGISSPLGKPYVKALSLAFVKAHITNQSEYLPYLSANYAQSISRDAFQLHLIKSLKPEELVEAFGDVPPVPIFPESETVPN